MDAAYNGHVDIVNLLIDHKARVDNLDNSIRSALHFCAFKVQFIY